MRIGEIERVGKREIPLPNLTPEAPPEPPPPVPQRERELPEITRSTSDVAVCCSSASVRSLVRSFSSLSSRAFSYCLSGEVRE
jgi:hypothetical protein